MASVFSSVAPMTGIGPVADAAKYTQSLGYSGMGPVASGQQYGQFLQSQQPGLFSQLGSGLADAGKAFNTIKQAQQKVEPMQMMQLSPMRQAGPLQSTDLLALLRNLGGLQ